MLILGLNAYHGDAAACVLRDGVLVAAAEEERFRRVKHWAGVPALAAAWCLRAAGAEPGEVDVVAVNSDPRANLLRKAGFALRRRPELGLVLDRIRNARERTSVVEALSAELGARLGGEVRRIEHHRAHLASAFLASPFERAVAVSIDGFGDFASAAWGAGEGTRIDVDERVYFPHSLGIFYQALTQYLGFPRYGDEYKVMGLAPYGRPAHMEQMRRLVGLRADGAFELGLDYFRHHREKIDYQWDAGAPEVGRLWSDALPALLGAPRGPDDALEHRHHDVAASVQAMYEEAFFHLLNTLHARYRCDDLVVAGGCGMNSVANGKVRLRTPFRRLWVQPAAGDAGGALGAALAAWHEIRAPAPRAFVMDHAFWGPPADEAEIDALLAERRDDLAQAGCRVERMDERAALLAATADDVAAGCVVGWFQGRMEWGPRALGNRSIVCDPRRADMKEILNAKIKRRESFRPFAPSVLREHVAEWFEQDDEVPFMMKVFQIREAQRPRIPAVTHVDGSGRLQTVRRETNPLYYDLIDAFRERTGVPMVLNTSFNENEPVVCRPVEALDCFLRTRMDVLVLGRRRLARAAP